MTTNPTPYSGSPAACAHDASSLDEARPAARSGDKKGNRKHRKNVFRDARARLVLQRLQASAVASSGEGTSVKNNTPLTLPSTLHVSPTSTAFNPNASTPAPSLFVSTSSKADRAWRPKEIILPGLSIPRKPAPWRDLGDELRTSYFNAAVAAEGGKGFTLDLDEETEAKALAAPSAVDFLRRRLARELGKIDLAEADFWFRLEKPAGGRLHLHGGIAAPEGVTTPTALRRALRRAGGEWVRARQHQAVLSEGTPDEAWATYSSKDAALTRPGGLYEKHGRKPFKGKPLYASNGLKRKAEALYAADRKLIRSL